MLEPVKISQLAGTSFVTPQHVFLIVRDGVTALRSWAELTATDLLVLVSGGETKATTYANVAGALSGATPPTPGADVAGTGFKISELTRTDSVSGPDLFVVSQPGEEATITADAFAIRESKLKRIPFDAINALLAPAVLNPVTLYPQSYATEAAAILGGVTACGLYRIDQGNNYGVPSPLGATLLRNATGCAAPSYANQADAEAAGVSVGDVYSVSAGNDYGIISAGGRGVAVVVGETTPSWKGPFTSFAAAEAGGVLPNEAFLISATNELGIISANNVPVVRVQ